MICGSEDLSSICKNKISGDPNTLSADGKFSWEEVECLGSCSNAPMVQIGKDYYEDLSKESFSKILKVLAEGEVPKPGPQSGRYASEPITGLTSLTDYGSERNEFNASVQLAVEFGDTIKRITGKENLSGVGPEKISITNESIKVIKSESSKKRLKDG